MDTVQVLRMPRLKKMQNMSAAKMAMKVFRERFRTSNALVNLRKIGLVTIFVKSRGGSCCEA